MELPELPGLEPELSGLRLICVNPGFEATGKSTFVAKAELPNIHLTGVENANLHRPLVRRTRWRQLR